MKKNRKYLQVLIVALICFTASGCFFKSSHHRSSSVMEYLYPDSPSRTVTPGIPNLQLPLQVGIAFVPDNALHDKTLTERDKVLLMKEVGERFKQHAFVKSIELIPSAYITKAGGFSNLDQIRTMHGIDVIALLSYDQTQFTDEGLASLTYWTLVGAYIIPGEKNDTHTMLDAAVYDIQSRKLLFRAPGISHIKSIATPVNLEEKLRKDRMSGFHKARADLVLNLETQLALFKEKVKERPAEYRVYHKSGYTGGGSVDAWFILLMGIMGGWALWRRCCR